MRRRATYADLERVPDHLVAEIVEGELFTSPRPAVPHARAASVMGSVLIGAFDGPLGGANRPGGWWILDEPELHLGADVIVPDLAGWRRDRMAALPNAAAIADAPDWACEVVSPSTVVLDRTRKMRIYARERTSHLWLVDPIARRLEVYVRDGDGWALASEHAGDATVRAQPFEAIELDVARWWL